MAARAEQAQRKRLLQARIGAGVAGAVVIALVTWIAVAVTGDDGKSSAAQPTASATPTACEWLPEETDGASPNPGIKNVGTPPTDVARSGFQVLTFNTNLGAVKVEMDLSKTPCTAANLAYLAQKKFYDGSKCHRLVDTIFALQCGDPTGTGSGGASYRLADENLPTDKLPAYRDGDVAMANRGEPATNGSQFFFLFGNSPLPAQYSLFGHVITGLDIVKKVAAGGDDGAFAEQAGGGHPKIKFVLTSVTAGPVTPTSSATAASAPTSSAPSSTPTATPAP